MSHYDINTVRELVDSLADTQVELAAELGITQPAVANWIARGAVPHERRVQIMARVIRAGLSVDPALFDLSPEDAATFRISAPSASAVA